MIQVTAKTPTPQAISALLRKAGFERSVSSATRIKGWHDYSAGYMARGYGADSVEVRHMTGFDRGERAARARGEMLGRYADAITAAGWAVERTDYDQLIVTAPEES